MKEKDKKRNRKIEMKREIKITSEATVPQEVALDLYKKIKRKEVIRRKGRGRKCRAEEQADNHHREVFRDFLVKGLHPFVKKSGLTRVQVVSLSSKGSVKIVRGKNMLPQCLACQSMLLMTIIYTVRTNWRK